MGFFSGITKAFSGLGGSLLSGGASLLGGALQNTANAKQASTNRDFQQYNSDTAYQRSMKDMKKAGLNPILAGKFGGASTPAGAMATMGDPITTGVNTGMMASKTGAEVDLKEVQAELEKTKNDLSQNLIPGTEAISLITSNVAMLLNSLNDLIHSNNKGYDKVTKEVAERFTDWDKKAKALGYFMGDLKEDIMKALGDKADEVIDGVSDYIKWPKIKKD